MDAVSRLGPLCNDLPMNPPLVRPDRHRAVCLSIMILRELLSAGVLPGLMRPRKVGDLLPAGWMLLGLIVGWPLSSPVLLAAEHGTPSNDESGSIGPVRDREFGRASLQVVFPAGNIGRREPLVSSGSGQDVLYIWYSGENEIRIGFHHVGTGGPVSAPLPIVSGRTYALELDLGCFYPPLDHPAFAHWPETRARLLQRQLVVLLDGNPVLDGSADFHPTIPADIHFGENPGPYVAPGKFSGTLGPVRHSGIVMPFTMPAFGGGGPLRLTVRFPPFRYSCTEPLVSTGHDQAGDLLYVTYLAPRQIRFGHCSGKGAAVETSTVAYEPAAPQTLELEIPSLSLRTDDVATGRLILRYNGTVLLADDRPPSSAPPSELVFGFNGSDSSVATMNFTGEIERVERIPFLSQPLGQFQTEPGPVRLVLRFPTGMTGRNEPILVTGRAGAADILYIQYVDESHVRVGYDHWGKGGPVSDPIAVDYSAAQTIEIQLGSLFPTEDDPAWARLPTEGRTAALGSIQVRLNGRPVLQHQEQAYRSEPGEILVGLNTIVASTCEPMFTGRIFLQERLGLPVSGR